MLISLEGTLGPHASAPCDPALCQERPLPWMLQVGPFPKDTSASFFPAAGIGVGMSLGHLYP